MCWAATFTWHGASSGDLLVMEHTTTKYGGVTMEVEQHTMHTRRTVISSHPTYTYTYIHIYIYAYTGTHT